MDDLFYNMTGIKIVVICPGVTITPLVLNADQRMTCYNEIRDESKKIFEAHPVQEYDGFFK
jgi:2-succinyl-5-enolpyruvyl-6-hydroxy-3-cyclohexene-1-carboxylate synthase